MTEDLEQSYLDKIYKKNCEIKKLKEESDNWEYKKNKYHNKYNSIIKNLHQVIKKEFENKLNPESVTIFSHICPRIIDTWEKYEWWDDCNCLSCKNPQHFKNLLEPLTKEFKEFKKTNYLALVLQEIIKKNQDEC